MPEDKARITAALRDQVWQGLKEPWIDPAIKPGQEPEAPPAAG